MRKPVIDYRTFRVSKINEPQFAHLKYLIGWIGYFAMYILTEDIIPYDKCYVVHSALDDFIPFCEYFVIPYVGWYLLIVGSLIYFALYNPDNFKNMSKYIIVTQLIAMLIYIVFPNRQDLRPEVFERDNICTQILGFLYTIDTNTNVCPSLHVAYSLGIASTWLREKSVARWVRIVIVVFCILVCISVAFVKQHSVIDIFVALPLCAFAEWFTFWRKHK